MLCHILVDLETQYDGTGRVIGDVVLPATLVPMANVAQEWRGYVKEWDDVAEDLSEAASQEVLVWPVREKQPPKDDSGEVRLSSRARREIVPFPTFAPER